LKPHNQKDRVKKKKNKKKYFTYPLMFKKYFYN